MNPYRFLAFLFVITNAIVFTHADEGNYRYITILGTNDIHGGIEPSYLRGSQNGAQALVGGLEQLAAAVDAIREGVDAKYKEKGGVILADAGDQFQGTLLSNINEGTLVFQILKILNYTAAIPGNHDYDFGPTGWLDDKVNTQNKDKDPRGAFKKLVAIAKNAFPLISANTYRIDSLRDTQGKRLRIASGHCRPVDGNGKPIKATIDWGHAEHPEFLQEYKIVSVGDTGVKVALIGLDNALTKAMTTAANVEDLCFRDLVDTYLDVRKKLESKADIFVIVTHEGDVNPLTVDGKLIRPGSSAASDLFRPLARANPPLVDAVIAGHTHNVNDLDLNQGGDSGVIPLIQSGSGGQRIGRIDLVWDAKNRRLVREKTSHVAGVLLAKDYCDPKAKFCSLIDEKVAYDGIVLKDATKEPVKSIHQLIESAKEQKEYIARTKMVVGITPGRLRVERYNEASLPNVLADLFLSLAREKLNEKLKNDAPEIHIALLNASGVRGTLPKGVIRYPRFFEILPFNNHAVVIGPMKIKTLVDLFKVNVTSCGSFGALMQSGLRITYQRNCNRAVEQIDQEAQLLKLELVDPSSSLPQVLYEKGKPIIGGDVNIVTMDFIAAGGERFKEQFDTSTGIREIADLGVLRELLAKKWQSDPPHLEADENGEVNIDGRYKNVTPEQASR